VFLTVGDALKDKFKLTRGMPLSSDRPDAFDEVFLQRIKISLYFRGDWTLRLFHVTIFNGLNFRTLK
jgi:hypothetical protein